jgi:hypothetical protein
MGINGAIEGLMENHPLLAALGGTIFGAEVNGHGLLRSIFDGVATYETARGEAGVFSELNAGLTAREDAMKVAAKAGQGWLGQQFAGLAAGIAAFKETEALSRDIHAHRTGTKTEKTEDTGLKLSALKPLLGLG